MAGTHREIDPQAKVEQALKDGKGCDAARAMEGMSMGKQLDVLREYSRKAGDASKHLPQIDIDYSKDGTLTVKPADKGAKPEEAPKSPNSNEQSLSAMAERPLIEKSVDPKGNVQDFQCHNQTPAEKGQLQPATPGSNPGNSPMEAPHGTQTPSNEMTPGGGSAKGDLGTNSKGVDTLPPPSSQGQVPDVPPPVHNNPHTPPGASPGNN